MVIQILVTVAVVIFIIPNLFASYKKSNLTLLGFLTWSFFWIVGLLVIWIEDLIGIIGDILGVTRSIDALIYLSIIFLLYSYINQKIKINEINREITDLTREIALKDIKEKGDDKE
ncbi:MAG: hypothetical protein XD93_0412 [candidate division WS6 bacterium 34_10]|uniref:Transmembrane(S)protein n=1 Tax=candidate division WS6 bacterium 34_10 TaxID=1641389 RepID=A0A101HI70_9BACT|nr:MAG: hypothetical protein XD93_0412 [candidate division WS6 bacterium 34_10]